jgi:hypothetical protein
MATKNDWFTTSLKNRSPTNLCDFEIQMAPYDFNPDSFMNQAKRVAHELAEKHDKIYVCYSGGLDSEFVLKTFCDEGLPITPVLIDTPYNQMESEWAYNFCKEKGVKPEVLSFSKNDILDRLKEKTIDRNLFSLLGGLPLIVCDEVNKQSGKLITGYGDPFIVQSGNNMDETVKNKLQFCEWDYYLDDYDPTHPSGFFTYDIGLFFALICEIQMLLPLQQAKSKLYQLPNRIKMFWKKEFYETFHEMKLNIETHYCFMEKSDLISDLNKFIK